MLTLNQSNLVICLVRILTGNSVQIVGFATIKQLGDSTVKCNILCF